MKLIKGNVIDHMWHIYHIEDWTIYIILFNVKLSNHLLVWLIYFHLIAFMCKNTYVKEKNKDTSTNTRVSKSF
jgi:hypothetical protein